MYNKKDEKIFRIIIITVDGGRGLQILKAINNE